MTSRMYVLAGLVVALAVPVAALASSSGPTWDEIQANPVLRQRSAAIQQDVTSTTSNPKDFDLRHYQAMMRGADHHAANAIAAPETAAAPSAEATRAWSLRHWQAMQRGCDHETASFEASKG